MHRSISVNTELFSLTTDADNFAEWMAHETFAETRRRAFVKSPIIDDIFDKLTQFAKTSLDEKAEQEGEMTRREMFMRAKYNIK